MGCAQVKYEALKKVPLYVLVLPPHLLALFSGLVSVGCVGVVTSMVATPIGLPVSAGTATKHELCASQK